MNEFDKIMRECDNLIARLEQQQATAERCGYDCYSTLKVHWWFDYYQTDTEVAMRWPSLALVCF